MTVRVPDGLHVEVRRVARERGVVMNDLLVEFLRRWVEHYGGRA
jgi:predicted HicB family RNase H-like nuclease